MAITSEDELAAALYASQAVSIIKTGSRVTVAAGWFSLFDVAGQPGAGTLAGTSVAAGVVPTDATDGCPTINAFTGAKGFITGVQYACSVATRLRLSDMLWKGGAYPFNATQTLAAQPSYSSRVPSGTDFTNLQIWFECVTAFTGNPTVTVTYTNDLGTTGRTTGAIAFGLAPTLGRMIQLPLQAGDRGVQKIESVTCTVASVGTFNILVLRPLWQGRAQFVNGGGNDGPARTGLVQVFADSALFAHVNADGTSSGILDILANVGNS